MKLKILCLWRTILVTFWRLVFVLKKRLKTMSFVWHLFQYLRKALSELCIGLFRCEHGSMSLLFQTKLEPTALFYATVCLPSLTISYKQDGQSNERANHHNDEQRYHHTPPVLSVRRSNQILRMKKKTIQYRCTQFSIIVWAAVSLFNRYLAIWTYHQFNWRC